MSKTNLTTLPQTEALMRSRLYKLFAIGFRYPTAESFGAFTSGEYLSAIWDCIDAVPHLSVPDADRRKIRQRIRATLRNVTLLDHEVGYNSTFETGTPEPPCPLYEGVFRKEENRAYLMIEVSEFYKHFGLKVCDEEGKREMPDHLCGELEFMHFLTFKEAQARHAGDAFHLQGYLHAQKDFMERHLLTWIPELAAKLKKTSALRFYAHLSSLLERCLMAEGEWLGEQVPAIEMTEEPEAVPVEAING